ncbi:hypothetical protein [Jatrophihabitans sp.]|uniref:hypothetical protein n=1 Tax=Jatrophihabitans sp. TaxID=1932789 RepID=UPI002EEB9D97
MPVLGGLVLLSSWGSMAGSAGAASYPPALGCGVSGLASAGSGLVQVRGIGFDAGSRVLVRVDGRNTGAIRADAAGSFQASWRLATPAAGAAITASDAGCSATGVLVIENSQGGSGNSGQPGPAKPAKNVPPSEPVPPARRADPVAAIPSTPLTGLPPQLFLGLAGAVMLAGAALIGLTGRLGHRSDRPASSEISVSSTYPTAPGTT